MANARTSMKKSNSLTIFWEASQIPQLAFPKTRLSVFDRNNRLTDVYDAHVIQELFYYGEPKSNLLPTAD